jgi:excisionase family DNA binding protein
MNVSQKDIDERATTVGPEEAAKRLGVTARTLANWRWQGRGPRFVRVGRKIRFRLSDLAAWLDTQTRASTTDRGVDSPRSGSSPSEV